MSTTNASAATPKTDFNTILQLGLRAYNLALTHAAALDGRLPPGTTAALQADLDALAVVVPVAHQARAEARTATTGQNAALQVGYERIQAVRTAARKARAAKEVQKAYGVGHAVHPGSVRDVKSGLQQIIDRAKANPAEAAALGILPKDLDAMTAAHAGLHEAERSQERKRAAAPLTTQERNRTANRVVVTVARIAGAGALEFAGDASTRAAFEALTLPTRKKRAAKPKGPEAPKPAPAPDAAAPKPSPTP